LSAKQVALGIIIGILVGVSIWYFLPQIQLGQQPTNAIKVTVYGGQVANVTISGNSYCFLYIQKGTSGIEEPYFAVAKPDSFFLSYALNSYVATVGSHYGISLYNNQVINVVVSSVQNDYLILQITPS